MQLQVVPQNNLILMQILFISLLVVVFFGTLQVSYSQMVPPEEVQNVPYILLQQQIRNSDDQLVAYVEGTKILRINPTVLNEYLDSLSSKKIISKDGKNYELIQWQASIQTIKRTHSLALYYLYAPQLEGKRLPAVSINYDAYQVEPGDKILASWTVLRTTSP